MIEWVPTCQSTQAVYKQRLTDGSIRLDHANSQLFAVATNKQTSGVGRHGRSWVMGPDALAISVGVTQPLPRSQWLPAAAAMAMLNCLQPRISKKVLLKWPNDLLIDAKKFTGIIVHGHQQNSTIGKQQTFIIGMGVNLFGSRQWFRDRQLPQATSIHAETQLELTSDDLGKKWLHELQCMLQKLDNDIAQFVTEYREAINDVGRQVIVDGRRGRVTDISLSGELIVQFTDDNIEKVIAGIVEWI